MHLSSIIFELQRVICRKSPILTYCDGPEETFSTSQTAPRYGIPVQRQMNLKVPSPIPASEAPEKSATPDAHTLANAKYKSRVVHARTGHISPTNKFPKFPVILATPSIVTPTRLYVLLILCQLERALALLQPNLGFSSTTEVSHIPVWDTSLCRDRRLHKGQS